MSTWTHNHAAEFTALEASLGTAGAAARVMCERYGCKPRTIYSMLARFGQSSRLTRLGLAPADAPREVIAIPSTGQFMTERFDGQGLRVGDLARMVGTSPGIIRKVLAGNDSVMLRHHLRVCKALGISVEMRAR